jgi:hypothetical protein
MRLCSKDDVVEKTANEEIHNSQYSPDIMVIKSRKMGWAEMQQVWER